MVGSQACPSGRRDPGSRNRRQDAQSDFKKLQETQANEKHLQERVMRQMITGLIAAVAVMDAAPAMACGFSPCGAPVYSAPVVNYGYGYGSSGCNPCGGGSVAESLADPDEAYSD